MARAFISPYLIFITFWTLSICFTNAVTVEEQLHQLKENFEGFSAKVSRLEELLELKNRQQDILEAKHTRLELKVHQQELLLISLQKEKPISTTTATGKTKENRKKVGKYGISRTCRETRAADPSLTSGMYWIDPDGQSVGDDPIYVYCDMTLGTTSVLHDSEPTTDVGHCTDPGCYSRAISYYSTNRQMSALAQLSGECHQSIMYNCTNAPLEVNDVAYSWWNDRNGIPQYFWSGNNASVHICQCGIDHNCVESFMPCNCDSGLQIPLSDNGVITDKLVLPITRLNFGRTILEGSIGLHTLGRFECSGQLAVNGMASSCEDLWRIGHTLSGLYSVMGLKQVENVYCDFAKLPSDSGFQTWIGYDDVKSSPTYFYVQKNSNFNMTNTSIPFEVERLNIGRAMNLSSGIFTVPRAGRYFFAASGLAYFPSSSTTYLSFHLSLMFNGYVIASGFVDKYSTVTQFGPYSLQSTLNLQAGDKIWLQIQRLSLGAYLYDSGYTFTDFTGWLVEEDVSPSLNVA